MPFKLSNFVAKALGNFLYRVNPKSVRVCEKIFLCYPDLSVKTRTIVRFESGILCQAVLKYPRCGGKVRRGLIQI